jgi:mono/diheme cytochrome c family protein
VIPGGGSKKSDMTRVTCLLGLIALAILILVSVRLDGTTAQYSPSSAFRRWWRRWGSTCYSAGEPQPSLDGQVPLLDQVMRTESSMRYAISLIAALPLSFASISLAAAGASLFKQNCASCHGTTGQADTPAGKSLKVPALAGAAQVAAMSDADVAAAIKANPKHAAVLKQLTDSDVAALANYAKGLAAGK